MSDLTAGQRRNDPLNHPGHYIRRLHQISVSIFLREAQTIGLTQVQFGALITIANDPGIDQATLCRYAALDRQTASTVIQRLIDKGLVDRKAKNGRAHSLFLTPGTKRLINRMQKRLNVVDDLILGPLDAAEKSEFMRMLVKLVTLNNDLSRAPQQQEPVPEQAGDMTHERIRS